MVLLVQELYFSLDRAVRNRGQTGVPWTGVYSFHRKQSYQRRLWCQSGSWNLASIRPGLCIVHPAGRGPFVKCLPCGCIFLSLVCPEGWVFWKLHRHMEYARGCRRPKAGPVRWSWRWLRKPRTPRVVVLEGSTLASLAVWGLHPAASLLLPRELLYHSVPPLGTVFISPCPCGQPLSLPPRWCCQVVNRCQTKAKIRDSRTKRRKQIK